MHYVYRQTPAVTRWKSGQEIPYLQWHLRWTATHARFRGRRKATWLLFEIQDSTVFTHNTQFFLYTRHRYAWEHQAGMPLSCLCGDTGKSNTYTHTHTTHTYVRTHPHPAHTHSCIIPVCIHFSPGYDALSPTPFLCKLLEFVDPLGLQLVEGLPRRQTHVIHSFRVWHT